MSDAEYDRGRVVGSSRSVPRVRQTPEFDNGDSISRKCRSLVIETVSLPIFHALTL